MKSAVSTRITVRDATAAAIIHRRCRRFCDSFSRFSASFMLLFASLEWEAACHSRRMISVAAPKTNTKKKAPRPARAARPYSITLPCALALFLMGARTELHQNDLKKKKPKKKGARDPSKPSSARPPARRPHRHSEAERGCGCHAVP